MTKGTASSRLDRLERLKGILRAGRLITSAEIASELGVSLRSLRRDIALLRNTGVPVEADRGRGGGIRLMQRWSFGRVNLDFEEAIDLLLSVAIAERMNSPLLLQRLPSVRQKLATAFSDVHQARIRQLRERILIGANASGRVAAGYRQPFNAELLVVKRAFFEMRRLHIDYADEAGRLTARDIEPQYLYLNVPAWYLLAWDGLRDAVRFFRLDRIRHAAILDSTFRTRDRRPFLAQAEAEAKAL